MGEIEIYSKTTSDIASAVPCHAGTVVDYCNWGLIPYRRLGNGVRLLSDSAVEQVRTIRAQRLKRRGGQRRAVLA